MFTWGLSLEKTAAYPRLKLRTGEVDWRWSATNGWPDLKEVRAVRKNGAIVLKDDIVKENRNNTTTQT